jgi:hypothetical protein
MGAQSNMTSDELVKQIVAKHAAIVNGQITGAQGSEMNNPAF